MATEIRRKYTGPHPVKKSRHWRPGEPLECSAEVLVVVADDRIAISMNGTAVLTPDELQRLVVDIANSLEA